MGVFYGKPGFMWPLVKRAKHDKDLLMQTVGGDHIN